MDKQQIARELKPITIQQVLKDYEKLKNINLELVKPLSRTGNKVVDYFTYYPRLNTKGFKGISFFDFIENLQKYNKGSIKRTFEKIKEIKPYLCDTEICNQIFRLYYGSISIFKPINAMKIYTQFKPKCVLDFTMGWGGRLVGACVLNIEKYIGIDSNPELENPYKLMTEFLRNHSTTEIELYFTDALTIDYSKLEYDMVFTSPPYYNIELYSGTEKKTEQEWNTEFYQPIFENTYQHLKTGGFYCLNVSIPIYEKVCVKVLGECLTKIPLVKFSRQNMEYKEFIYIWKK